MRRTALRPSRCRSRWLARSLALSLVFGSAWLLLAATITGCGQTCDTSGQEPITYTDGLHPSASSYESNDPNGAWLHFPAGRRYRFPHGLGTSDLEVMPYLAFDEHPLGVDGGAGNSSPGSGNAVIIEAVNKDYVQLRNDTCAEYWLWVVIRSLDSPASASDGGVD